MMRRREILHLLSALGLVVVFLVLSPLASQAQTDSSVMLESAEVGLGQTGTVAAHIFCAATSCNGFAFELRFDPAQIDVRRVELGPYLGTSVFISEETIDHEAGVVRFAAVSVQPPPADAEDVLFLLEIEGRALGKTPLVFSALNVIDGNGRAIPAQGEGTIVTVVDPTQQPTATPTPQPQPTSSVPCTVWAESENVRVRVGPGTHRGVFAYMPPNRPFTVIGQAQDRDGETWFQLDKDMFPRGEKALSLWVKADEVTQSGPCQDVPQAEAPPVILNPSANSSSGQDQGQDQGQSQASGTWGACGSCDSCGYPSWQCVSAPDGQCVWDPSRCSNPASAAASAPSGGGTSSSGGGGGGGGGGVTCYTLTANAYGAGGVNVLTPPTCGSGYKMGDSVELEAVPAGYFYDVDSWWGTCDNIPPGNPLTAIVTINGDCEVNVSFVYIGP